MTAAAAAAAHQPATQPLPFLGDDIFVLIAAELDARMLGRLACVAQRFWRKSVPDPAHKGSAPPELWSVAEEGARRRLAAQSEMVRGWVSREKSGGSWLRTLWEAEKLQRPLFAKRSISPRLSLVATSRWEKTADTVRSDRGEGTAICAAVMRRGVHRADFTVIQETKAVGVVMAIGVIEEEFAQGFFERRFEFPHASSGPAGWAWGADGGMWHDDAGDESWSTGTAWEGSEGWEQGDVLSLELDVDRGTLTAFKAGARLGVLAEGLNAEGTSAFCWTVELAAVDDQVAIAHG